MQHVIGIDLGSQSLKGALLEQDGRVLATAARPYRFTVPQPGWAEQDPDDWWRALLDVVRELTESSGVGGLQVVALALASQVDGLVAADEAGTPVYPAIIWFDRRAESQAQDLGRHVSKERLFGLSGLQLDSSHVAPKILWLREREPEVWRRVRRLHLPGSWLVERLTGRAVVDHSNASSTLLYDVRTRGWAPELLSAAALFAEQLPQIAAATDVAGGLTDDAAAALGRAPGCPVAVGCGDEHGACLGAGVLRPGPVCDIAGTAEPVAVASDRPVFDPGGLVETHAHADPARWLIENPGFVSGGSVRWLADLLGVASAEELVALAGSVPAGSDGQLFLPALSGAMTPRWNAGVRGVFSGLSLAHGRGHVARAVFEGCAYGVRDIVERFVELGLPAEEIRVVGGGARSDALLQLKADVTGRACRRVASDEATALGAALVASVAAGFFRDLTEAAGTVVRLDPRIFEPDLAARAVYDDGYQRYRALFDAVEPLAEGAP